MNSLSKEITRQFYEWEQCGRGWFLFDDPVQLEPPFEPFYFHQITPHQDDGKIDSLAVAIWKNLFGKKEKPPEATDYLPAYFFPYEFENDEPISFLIVTISKEAKVRSIEMEELLVMLSYSNAPISFEIIATATHITFQFACRESDKALVKNQIKAYLSSCQVTEQTADQLFGDGSYAAVIDFGLGEEFMRPIATVDRFDVDPFTSLSAVLNNIDVGDQVALQVLFSGALNAWSKIIVDSVSDYEGKCFFSDAPEMLPLAKEKAKHPLFGVAIRAISQSSSLEKTQLILEQLKTVMVSMSRSNCNCLVPLGHPHYGFESRVTDMKLRQSRRIGMLLNSKELGTFIHLPSPGLFRLKGSTNKRKTIAAPAVTQNNGVLIGLNKHEGVIQEIRLSNNHRLRHTHVIGATGTGKSTLLLNMISEDIEGGNGVCVLDPHGDLITSVLQTVPEERTDDVILIDPSDSDYPISFNILHAHDEIEKEILSSDLVAVFRRLSSSWGDQMNSVFANAILALLESPNQGTLADLRRFLIEKSYREEWLTSVTDPSIRYYWQKEYPLLKTNSIGPILTRLDTFLRPRLIRNMVCQKQGINFDDILNNRKILLVKLSQGLIGTENSYLLGSFVVAKIHQATFARQAQDNRNDFFFYIDEFHHFTTPSMVSILTGARKYHTGLILAHQNLQQLQKYDDVGSALIANAGIRICFRVGGDGDSKKLAEGFSSFESQDLQNLNIGEAIGRIERPDYDFSFETIPHDIEYAASSKANFIMERSRQKYATPREIVELELEEAFGSYQKEENRQSSQVREEKRLPEAEEKNPEIKSSIHPEMREDKRKDLIESTERRRRESQHRYLQTLIKKMGEARGYKVTLEAPVLIGPGKVDVLLEKEHRKIACEVSVTTDANWELHNIEKCLGAGYDMIVSCMADKKGIIPLQRKMQETFSELQMQKVKVLEPDALFAYLDESIRGETETETTIKGYRVKVSYDSVSESEMKRKRDSVAKIVVDSLKKMKK